MTPDRPTFVPNLFQRRYWELLALAENSNAAEILVTASDWYVLTQCHPGGAKFSWLQLTIDGRQYTRKPPNKPPSGTLDLTGDEPVFEP